MVAMTTFSAGTWRTVSKPLQIRAEEVRERRKIEIRLGIYAKSIKALVISYSAFKSGGGVTIAP
jgi:hypothetical protein